MFWNKSEEIQPVDTEEEPVVVKAKDLKLTYTSRSVTVYYIMENGDKFSDTYQRSLFSYLDAKTAWNAKEKLDEDICNAIDRANDMIKAAFNGNPKYMNFNKRYIRAEYCVSVEICTGDNSWYVKDESEDRPDDGWPWNPDEE